MPTAGCSRSPCSPTRRRGSLLTPPRTRSIGSRPLWRRAAAADPALRGRSRTRGYGGVMAHFVDWDLAAATAGALGKSGPRVSTDEARDAVADLHRLAHEAAGH